MIRFFAGKGGVGKTTCAAAFAASLARGGARTLVVSTDPAHSLGDAIEARLGAAPRQVRGRLFAAQMDADRALSRWLRSRERAFRNIAARGTYLDDEDIDALFRLSLPGVDELVALVELTRLSRGFDELVVDTAPTGHTLRLLETPQMLAKLATVLDDLQAKHRAMALSLRGTARRDAEDQAIEELQEQARSLHAVLRSAGCEVRWIFLAEELALAETRDGVAALRAAGIHVHSLVANRLVERPGRPCALCDGRRAAQAVVLREAAALGLPIEGVPELEREPRGLRALQAVRPVVLGHLTKKPAVPSKPRAKSLGHLTKKAGDWPGLLAPAGVRLLFVGGKGGVGKTTIAATAALELARRGRRVLLLSTDPAHSLGDVLQLAIGDEEREVAPRLRARELDANRAFAARREQYRAAIDELFDTLRGGARFDAPYDRAVMQDLVDLAPPGIDELFALLAVVDALQRHDLVVVDTAPTGHALRLLQLIAKAREWVQVLMQILLKYRRVTGLGQLARDLTDTARELRELEQLLHDATRARFLAVARPAALPRLETARLLAGLRTLGVAAPVVLVNAVTLPGCPRCRRAAEVEAKEVALLRQPGWAMLTAPMVAPEPRGAAALEEFGRTWTHLDHER
ncbi:MAG TPA: TRC40/GET3/ArsA family transport-energizing ATPase [Myxococcales bacterium]|nr:TRC40/GET3/ArsA family transport-energizing ATPase [Myxococcales bacterium]